MFAPTFVTGSLIRRYGAPRIMQIGFVLLLAHVALALSGIGLTHFLSALAFLGVGWNFAFIGGTALLTESYRPGEQLRVQAANEFVVVGLVAIAVLIRRMAEQRLRVGRARSCGRPVARRCAGFRLSAFAGGFTAVSATKA